MSKKCPKCGAELVDTAKFCLECGFNIKEYEEKNAYVFCPECGAKYERGAKFCIECGTKIISDGTLNSDNQVKSADGFDGGFDSWNLSDGLDGWGDTLKKFNDAEEKGRFIDFEYEKMPNGKIVIKKIIDRYALEVTIPDGVSVIGDSAFENSGIISVTLCDGVTTIGKRAFASCKNLESINFPQSLVRIDDEAFLSCEKLEIKIPNTVKIVGNNAINGTKTEILKQRAEAEVKRKAEEEARRKTEAEAKRKAEEEAKKRAEEELQRKAEGYAKGFGSYYQSNSTTKDPIEWKVLAREGNKALLISEYVLDCKKYNEEEIDITWATCTLRKWLNEEFINTAFNETERSKIITTTLNNPNNPNYGTNGGNSTSDKIFLLSIGEAEKYFSIDAKRKVKPTAYALQKGAIEFDYHGNCCFWWLRSPGIYQSYASTSSINLIGYNGSNVNRSNISVRPALWINLES